MNDETKIIITLNAECTATLIRAIGMLSDNLKLQHLKCHPQYTESDFHRIALGMVKRIEDYIEAHIKRTTTPPAEANGQPPTVPDRFRSTSHAQSEPIVDHGLNSISRAITNHP
jgi:hypothetical protein